MDENSALRFSRINALKIIINFILFSAGWIILSGKLLDKIPIEPSLRNLIEILKGLLYVSITSLFLYKLIKKEIYISRDAIEKLKISENNFSRLFENASLAVFQSTPEGAVIIVNQAFSKMFGYESPAEAKREIKNVTMEIFVDANKRQEIINLKLSNPEIENFEVEYRRKNGSTFIGNLHLNLVRDDNEKLQFIEGFIEDITQRKIAEEKLIIFAQAVKSISECISITDGNNNILFVNEAFRKTYGYEENELIGKNISILRPHNTPDLNEILDATFSGGWKGELLNVKKDGTIFPIHLSTSEIKDDQGNMLALIGVATNITETKRIREEILSAKNEAEKASRIKTEFLAQMSHEIRSPLNISLNYISMIKEELGQEIKPAIKEYFNVIEISSRRLIRTIDLILNMSEMQLGIYKAEYEKIDLINDVFSYLNKEFMGLCSSKGLQYIFNSSISETTVFCDRYSVYQIFVNLLDNSFKYTSNGRIEVLISKDTHAHISIGIKDTGIGMSEEFVKDLFEPFTQEEHGYSRKYEGNGLGLALVKKYCDLNNAKIEVSSEKDVGSQFKVTFLNS